MSQLSFEVNDYTKTNATQAKLFKRSQSTNQNGSFGKNEEVVILQPKHAEYFQRRVCTLFVLDQKTGNCKGCRKAEFSHRENGLGMKDWTYKVCTKTQPTDAYGLITFPGSHSKTARYIRVQNETKPRDMVEYLYSGEAWNLQRPQLIISVTGGAQNFTIPHRMKKAFKLGLIKAAASTGAWIITGGTNTGVMRLVGEALAEEYHKYNANLTVLGIATWGTIEFKEKLTRNNVASFSSDDTKAPVFYAKQERNNSEMNQRSSLRASSVPATKSFVHLDPNHTHFILVDDGSEGSFGKEIEFRSQLEAELRKGKSLRYYVHKREMRLQARKLSRSYDSKNDHNSEQSETESETDIENVIPMILIVVQGGPNTLLTVEQSLRQNVPVLLLADSKGCADLICNACSLGSNASDEHLNALIEESRLLERSKVKPSYQQEINDAIARLKYILSKLPDNLINVFRLDSEGCGQDIELTILRAFLNCRQNEYYENLKLALQWNRSDIAKTDIFTGEEDFKPSQLAKLMEIALIQNKHEFVELMLENGLNLKTFLTIKRLIVLYNSQKMFQNARKAPLFKLYKKKYFSRLPGNETEKSRQVITFQGLFKFVKDLLSEDFSPSFLPQDQDIKQTIQYLQFVDNLELNKNKEPQDKTMLSFGSERVTYPEQNLFFWAIVMNRMEIAKIFWKIGEYQISSALFASNLFKTMSLRYSDQAEQLENNAIEFEKMAIGVLNIFDLNSDDLMNSIILLSKIPIYKMDCLQMAVKAKCLKFVSLPTVQNLITEIWNGNMSSKSGFKGSVKLGLSVVSFGFLAPFLLFDQKDKPYKHFRFNELDSKDSNEMYLKLKAANMLKGYITSDDTTFFARESNLIPRFFRKKDPKFGGVDDSSSEEESDDSDEEVVFDEDELDRVSVAGSVNLSESGYLRQARNMDPANVSDYERQPTPPPTAVRPPTQPVKLSKTRTYWNRYKSYVISPRVHFINEAVFNTLFLIIFSYLMLCEFYYYERVDPAPKQDLNSTTLLSNRTSTHFVESELKVVRKPTTLEYLLIYWISSVMIEEARQFFFSDDGTKLSSKLYLYFENNWNYLDLMGCLLFIVGMGLRFLSTYSGGEDLFTVARIVLCLDLSLWYMRLLHVSIIFKSLGPKLVMIQKMIFDLLFFLLIIAVFVCSFGVTTQSTLYPGNELSLSVIKNMLDNAYWPIYGEMKLLDQLENEECKDDCPYPSGVGYSYFALMLYMITANILLVNLLIAMFSSTFQSVQDNTDEIWRFQRYRLVFEYYDSSILPPPLNIIAYVISAVAYFREKRKERKSGKKNESMFDPMVDDLWREKKFAEEYLRLEKNSKSQAQDSRLKYTTEKIEALEQRLNEMVDYQIKESNETSNSINWLLSQYDADEGNRRSQPIPYLNDNRISWQKRIK